MSSRRQRSATVPKSKAEQQSLAQYMQSKVRAGCLICQLPQEVRAQLGREASKRGFSREDQVEWLRLACGAAKVTVEILTAHLNGKHDQGAS